MSRRSDGRHSGDDPVAMRSEAMTRFFTGVMRRQMTGAFRAVRVAGGGLPVLPEGRPVIVYANHPSWWDPAFFIVLADRFFPGRHAYGPIDADALRRYRFMRRIGLFGVEPATRAGAVRFLDVARRVLGDPGRMLWVTAQGSFADPRDRPLSLRPGVAHLMARVPEAVALPLAVEYPFWSEKRPEALAAFGAPLDGRDGGHARDWSDRLEAGLTDTMDGLATRAAARDPAAFERLATGKAGVGGVYAAVSRARAWAGGRRYVPDHVPENAGDRS